MPKQIKIGDQMSDREKAVYDYIVQYKLDNDGNSPAISDIMTAVGITTTSLVHYYLKQLMAKGYITVIDNKARSISVEGYEYRRVKKSVIAWLK